VKVGLNPPVAQIASSFSSIARAVGEALPSAWRKRTPAASTAAKKDGLL
jgi:hypothetical protein